MPRALLLLIVVLAACAGAPVAGPSSLLRSQPSTGAVPLSELAGTYQGLAGGLYGDGVNVLPPAAAQSAMAAAARVLPASGRFAVLAVGFSNWSWEFCCQATVTSNPAPVAGSFMARAKADPAVRREPMVLVNGAMYGQANGAWDDSSDTDYDLVRQRLATKRLTEAQVRVVLLKVTHTQPTVSLPSPAADVYALAASTGSVIRALRARYPNLQMVFLLSRIYGGYATVYLNPEPYAYEGGFAVQRVVRAKLAQDSTGAVDPLVGDLSGVWVGWGPYLWADGTTPRADGLTWPRGDFIGDGTHPSSSGIGKVAGQLLAFLKTTPHAACWFLAAGTC